jgi:conjugative transfer region protein TrbK
MRQIQTVSFVLALTCLAGAPAGATDSHRTPPARQQQAGDTTRRAPDDALGDELTRCLRLGDLIAHDPNCLRAWGDYGRRFLRAVPPTTGRPQQGQPHDPPAAPR